MEQEIFNWQEYNNDILVGWTDPLKGKVIKNVHKERAEYKQGWYQKNRERILAKQKKVA